VTTPANSNPVPPTASELTARVRALVQPGDTITIPETHYTPGTGSLRMEVTVVGTILQIDNTTPMVQLTGWETSRLLPGRWPRTAAVQLTALTLPGAVTRPLKPT
jgi:hypothetical protein